MKNVFGFENLCSTAEVQGTRILEYSTSILGKARVKVDDVGLFAVTEGQRKVSFIFRVACQCPLATSKDNTTVTHTCIRGKTAYTNLEWLFWLKRWTTLGCTCMRRTLDTDLSIWYLSRVSDPKSFSLLLRTNCCSSPSESVHFRSPRLVMTAR